MSAGTQTQRPAAGFNPRAWGRRAAAARGMLSLWAVSIPSPRCPGTSSTSLRLPSPPSGPLTSNCALLVLVELPLDEAEDEAGFADRGLPQQDQLKLTDLVPSSWSVGSRCASPTRHGPSRCSGTSERGGRGRCYAKRHLVGRGAPTIRDRSEVLG